ncbi:MAG: hypothetical protein LC101_10485 [Flavobacteriales bacterium]|nr:hypothetical protein [Flavobacteriales bacterium]
MKGLPFIYNLIGIQDAKRDPFYIDISQCKDVEDLNSKYSESIKKILSQCKSIPAYVTPGQIRSEINMILLDDPDNMRNIAIRVGIPFYDQADDYSNNQLDLIRPEMEKLLTNLRNERINSWVQIIKLDPPSIVYYVMKSLLHYLDKNRTRIPSAFFQTPFEKVISEFTEAEKDLDRFRNFHSVYTKAVIEWLITDPNLTVKVDDGNWLKFPKGSESSDVKETIIKVQAASMGRKWCTNSCGASYVIEGDDHDFYVFIPNEINKATISIIPVKEDEIDQLSRMDPLTGKIISTGTNCNYTGVFGAENTNDNKVAPQFLHAINQLVKRTKDSDLVRTLKIVGYTGIPEEGFGIVTKKEETMISFIDQYRNKIFTSDEDFRNLWKLFGINTKVDDKIITSEITDAIINMVPKDWRSTFFEALFGSVTAINTNGNLYLDKLFVQNTGKLKRIEGNVYFSGSQIVSISGLEEICGSAYFMGAKIKTLDKLKRIGGRAIFERSKIESLGELEVIGGSANFCSSKIKSMGNLRRIEGSAEFENSEITSLGRLIHIGGLGLLINSKVSDLGMLRCVLGDFRISGTEITDLKNLREVHGNLDLRGSKVLSLGKLEFVGGNVNFDNGLISEEEIVKYLERRKLRELNILTRR